MSLVHACLLVVVIGVALLARAYLLGKHRRHIVDRAVGKMSALKGRRAPGLDLRVRTVFWYGAIDISPRHCVIWILIEGSDSEKLPPWLFLSESPQDKDADKEAALPAPVIVWLRSLQDEVLAALTQAGWRHRPPSIGFESEERVARTGGRYYFQ